MNLRGFLHLLIVYLVWGSTYLAIRVAVRDESGFPPFFMAGARVLSSAPLRGPDFDPGEQALATASATLDHLAARLRRAMEHGLLKPIDPLHAAGIVWSTCHGVVSLELKAMKPDVIDWPAVYADATAAIVAGMAP